MVPQNSQDKSMVPQDGMVISSDEMMLAQDSAMLPQDEPMMHQDRIMIPSARLRNQGIDSYHPQTTDTSRLINTTFRQAR